MPHAGLFSLLAKGPICRRTEPTEFRQTIRARLSGDARLGQDSAGPALAEGSYRKNLREISGSISPTDRERNCARIAHSTKEAVMLSEAKHLCFVSVRAIDAKLNRDSSPATTGSE